MDPDLNQNRPDFQAINTQKNPDSKDQVQLQQQVSVQQKPPFWRRFLQNKKTLVFLAIIAAWAILLLVYYYFKNQAEPVVEPTPFPSPTPTSTERPVQFLDRPDNRSDIEQELGKPIGQQDLQGQLYTFYNSFVPDEKHSVVYEGDKVVFFKQILRTGDVAYSEIKEIYGEDYTILYGPGVNAGLVLYVYPEKGFAFYANESKEDILELWYFEPITIEDFVNKWASDFSVDRENISHF